MLLTIGRLRCILCQCSFNSVVSGSSQFTFSCHNCCMNILHCMITGLNRPNGSYIDAINLKTLRFVGALSCLVGTQNINLSVVGFHNNPNAFITSSFPKLNSNFLSTSSSERCFSSAG